MYVSFVFSQWDRLGPGTLCCNACTWTNVSLRQRNIVLSLSNTRKLLLFSHSVMSNSLWPPGLHLLELAETHVYQAGDAVQPSRPLLSPSPPAFNLQGLLQWVGFVLGGQSIGASAQRNCKGLKITACVLSWHKSWATGYKKTKKIQLLLLKSQEAKAHAPLHTWTPKGWADHLSHPPTQPLGPPLPSPV